MISKSHIPEVIDLNKGEVLLLDKPADVTSFQVVKMVREEYPGYVKKIGHAGTLDPMATGLLILCSGKMTKQISEFQGLGKTYEGTFRLGAVTPSLDAETEISETFAVDHIDEASIHEVAKQFEGKIEQMPPAYSALKVDGKRAYSEVRKGANPELRSRNVMIHELKITGIDWPEVHFKTQCSKGTYIRSLVSDMAKALASGGYLTALRRTAIGDYLVNDALTPDELKAVFQNRKKTEPS